MNPESKELIKHQLYRSGGKEVILTDIRYSVPKEENERRKVLGYLVQEVSLVENGPQKGEYHFSHPYSTDDLQPIGRVIRA